MVLNLRNLIDTPEPRTDGHEPIESFVCHGYRFNHYTILETRKHESGYHDRLTGAPPSSQNINYRQGYLEAILDEVSVDQGDQET